MYCWPGAVIPNLYTKSCVTAAGAPKAKHTDGDKKAHRHELKDYASPVVEMLEVMAVCNEARIEREKRTVDKKGEKKSYSRDNCADFT
jgi:hypothetical protein